MSRKRFLMGFGAILALLSMVVFAACEEPKDEGEDIKQIKITGIPTAGYHKIYLQLSNSQDASKIHAAEGAALIDGKSEITLPLLEPYSGAPDSPKDWAISGTSWTGQAKYLSVVICPKATSSAFTDGDWKEAEYHSFMVGDGKETKTFDWKKPTMNLKDNVSFNASAQKLFKHIIVPDPAVAP